MLEPPQIPELLQSPEPLLLLDTCGPRSSLCLLNGAGEIRERLLPERAVSVALLASIEEVLADGSVPLAPPLALGVVNGPGSFTGVRVGLAVAKGLAEAAGLRVGAVSRLSVLQQAAHRPGAVAVLWAGRDQVYARDAQGRETMTSFARLGEWVASGDPAEKAGEQRVVVCVQDEVARFTGLGWPCEAVALQARHARALVSDALAAGGTDVASMDANYVRDEGAIFVRAAAS